MEFHTLGAHCAVDSCRQRDFLPFTCDACTKPYCLDHRTYDSHDCPAAAGKRLTRFDCPICASSLRIEDGDANATWARHYPAACDAAVAAAAAAAAAGKPQKKKKKKKRKRCAAEGCHERLGPTNSLRCSSCGVHVCMAHRFPGDHACGSTGGRSSAAGAAASGRSAWLDRLEASFKPSKPKKAAKPAVASGRDGRSPPKRKKTKPAGRRYGAEARAEVVASAAARSGGGDACPNCGRQFVDAVALVAHVESGCAAAAATGENCPFCGDIYPAGAALIAHVRDMHSDAATGAAASGGSVAAAKDGSEDSCVVQ
eukprot:PLAT3286.14.p1 GENE.PLAT3286.14~~PLAT3286.14.p1  ORF type:complete len:313 (+),score=101.55 PLAT3286.14:293-1231(+)